MPLEAISTNHPRAGVRHFHLLYHELRATPAAYSYVTSAARFQEHVDLYTSLRDLGSPLRSVITFDDGHASNLSLAAPILASAGLTAHFFITAGWTESRSGYLDWSQLRALLLAGHAIGAHGWSHKFLTHCSRSELETELVRSRLTLEDRLGVPITTMSLPGGRANRRVLVACGEAGYNRIYTSVPRSEPVPGGPIVGRLNVRGDTETAWLAQLFAPASPLLDQLARRYRIKAAAQSILGDRLYARLWALVNHHDGGGADPDRGPGPDDLSPRQERSA